ncbi:unnamed protein product [Peniophora sp. CBMAI 1063]|nr:unnamed protein product [Peniophora sp. CBMAI 1063]
MVNFQSPSVIAADGIALESTQNVFCGLYLWEWITSLEYEIAYYRRKRPWRWTMSLYILCRVSILAAVINLFVGGAAATNGAISCTAWVKCMFLFSYLGVCMASLLIALRACAIWDRHWALVVFTAVSFLAQLALQIRSLVLATGARDSHSGMCTLADGATSGLPILAAVLAVDLTLLSLILIGLIRRQESRAFGLGRMLWKQGIVWIVVASLAEVPTVVFLSLDLNMPLDVLFLTPEMIILATAATRLYRSLSDFLVVRDESWVTPGSSSSASRTRGRFSAAISRKSAMVKSDPIPLDTLRSYSLSVETGGGYTGVSDRKLSVSEASHA